METLEPAVNHHRAAQISSWDHVTLQDDDAGVGLLLQDDQLLSPCQRLLTSPKTLQQIHKEALFG